MSRLRRSGLVCAVACCSVVLAACASGGRPSGTAARWSGPGAPPLPATMPYVAVTGPHTADAVWPSGPAWLVLGTTNGFHDVENRTPVGVETNGGLVAAFGATAGAVAVLPHERLLRSPLLTADGTHSWRPAELPGAVWGAQHAVGLRGRDPSAVLDAAHGTLVVRDGPRWDVLTSGHALDHSGTWTLDSVVWADATHGWVTGHGSTGAAQAFATSDAGRTWHAVHPEPGRAVAALAPCGASRTWVLPVIAASGAETFLRTDDVGRTWTPGKTVTVAAGVPAYGCEGTTVWTAAEVRGHEDVLASADAGRTWSDDGEAPSGLVALQPDSDGSGYAVAGGASPHLLALTRSGRVAHPVSLPSWVATIGETTSGD